MIHSVSALSPPEKLGSGAESYNLLITWLLPLETSPQTLIVTSLTLTQMWLEGVHYEQEKRYFSHPYHSRNSKDFRSFVPETRDRDQTQFLFMSQRLFNLVINE